MVVKNLCNIVLWLRLDQSKGGDRKNGTRSLSLVGNGSKLESAQDLDDST
jgi:hypothetical protein